MDERTKEHKRATGKGDVLSSAVAEHARLNKHAIAWDSAVAVDRELGTTSRKIKEAHTHCEGEGERIIVNKDDGIKVRHVWKVLLYRCHAFVLNFIITIVGAIMGKVFLADFFWNCVMC